MKASKVKSVQANGTYNSKFGLLYKFDYEMEDGTAFTANHKTETGNFNIGDQVEYEIKGSNDYGSWGSIKKPEVQGGFQGGGSIKKNYDDPKRQMIILAQSTMQKSVDILLSGVVAIEVTSVNDFVQKAEHVADIMMTRQIKLAKKHISQYQD